MKKVVLALLVVQLLFGLWHLVGSAALKTLSPEALIGFRAFVSTPLLFWMARGRGLRMPRGREWPLLIALGVLIIPGNQLLYANGLALAGPLNASVLIMLTPIFTLVGVLLIGQERFSWRKVLGILLAFSGAMGVIGIGQFATTGAGWGNVLLVAAAAAYGCYLIVGRAVFPSIGFLPGIAWVFLLGGIASSPWTLPRGPRRPLGRSISTFLRDDRVHYWRSHHRHVRVECLCLVERPRNAGDLHCLPTSAGRDPFTVLGRTGRDDYCGVGHSDSGRDSLVRSRELRNR